MNIVAFAAPHKHKAPGQIVRRSVYRAETQDPVTRAGGGARTHTILRSLDFESSASANSATPARKCEATKSKAKLKRFRRVESGRVSRNLTAPITCHCRDSNSIAGYPDRKFQHCGSAGNLFFQINFFCQKICLENPSRRACTMSRTFRAYLFANCNGRL